jgi:heme A synthase
VKRPNVSKIWLLTLATLALEEAAAVAFVNGNRNPIVLTIVLSLGALFALPMLWADQLRERGASQSELVYEVALGMAAIWAASYWLTRLFRGERISDEMGIVIYSTLFIAFHSSVQIVLERAFPNLNGFPSYFVLFVAIGWNALLILRSHASLISKFGGIFVFVVLLWLAFVVRRRKTSRVQSAPEASAQQNS